MRNDLMTLKEVCKETGVTRKIVQTYENYGLVKATTKNKYGYLLYDDAAVKKIKKIRLYQRFGYRLSEIAKLEYMTVDEQVRILKEKINNMYDNQSETAELIEMAEQLLKRFEAELRR
ncbi:MAG: MerR family transcriptional regulator [Eubacteriales bacterium]|nr:MerR family transcriptional regulator [Eubacteriales bacterium]